MDHESTANTEGCASHIYLLYLHTSIDGENGIRGSVSRQFMLQGTSFKKLAAK